MAVDSPLISFYPEGGSSSAYIGNLFLQIPEDEEDEDEKKDKEAEKADDEKEKDKQVNLIRLDFPGAIFASSSYPTGLVIKDRVIVRSSCLLGYLVVDFENQEARIYEVELCDPLESGSFN